MSERIICKYCGAYTLVDVPVCERCGAPVPHGNYDLPEDRVWLPMSYESTGPAISTCVTEYHTTTRGGDFGDD